MAQRPADGGHDHLHPRQSMHGALARSPFHGQELPANADTDKGRAEPSPKRFQRSATLRLPPPPVAEAGTAFVPLPPAEEASAAHPSAEMQCNFLRSGIRTSIAFSLQHCAMPPAFYNPVSVSGERCSALRNPPPSGHARPLNLFISDLRNSPPDEHPSDAPAPSPSPVRLDPGTAAGRRPIGASELPTWP